MNSLVALTLSVLHKKYRFSANLIQEKKCHFNLKFAAYTNLNLQNAMVMLTFNVLRQKYHFMKN